VRRLLLDEARAMARFAHPRIVELLDVGFTPDAMPFLVMELVDGGDLRSWTARFPGFRAVARLADDVLDALAEAHAAGVVHGDLKPSNVLRAVDGGFKLSSPGGGRGRLITWRPSSSSTTFRPVRGPTSTRSA
jgi:serine/threonine-protein kinase